MQWEEASQRLWLSLACGILCLDPQWWNSPGQRQLVHCCTAPQEDIGDLGALQVTGGTGYERDSRRPRAASGCSFLAGMSEVLAGGKKAHICQNPGACHGQARWSGSLKLTLLFSLLIPLSSLEPAQER